MPRQEIEPALATALKQEAPAPAVPPEPEEEGELEAELPEQPENRPPKQGGRLDYFGMLKFPAGRSSPMTSGRDRPSADLRSANLLQIQICNGGLAQARSRRSSRESHGEESCLTVACQFKHFHVLNAKCRPSCFAHACNLTLTG